MKIITQNKSERKQNKRRAEGMKRLVFAIAILAWSVGLSSNAYSMVDRESSYIAQEERQYAHSGRTTTNSWGQTGHMNNFTGSWESHSSF
jgi:hypothetical protein